MERNIIQEKRGAFIILTINRPKALNALNRGVFNDLEAFFKQSSKDLEGVKGIVITGSGGKGFAAGADIKEFDGLDAEKGKSLSERGHNIFNMIEQFHIPVIAAINGYSLGGGNELAMACHMRIAGAHAKFGQPEAKLGLIPGYGGTQRLVRYIGHTKAMELLLTCGMIGAEEAEHLGLVNKVVESGKEVEESIKVLEKIAQFAPLAIRNTIKAVNAYHVTDIDGFSLESKTFGELMSTKDFIEGAAAFVEKRSPNFTGK